MQYDDVYIPWDNRHLLRDLNKLKQNKGRKIVSA